LWLYGSVTALSWQKAALSWQKAATKGGKQKKQEGFEQTRIIRCSLTCIGQ
jgi:hypothetical protein